jgi:hypothetical protein
MTPSPRGFAMSGAAGGRGSDIAWLIVLSR